MKELICQQCGVHNAPHLEACEVCGDPLKEEKELEKQKEFHTLFLQAIFFTILFVGIPGWILYTYVTYTMEDGSPNLIQFSLLYTIIWCISLYFSYVYKPKEHYDIGGKYGVKSIDPRRAIQQEMAERHLWLGILLIPVHMVRELWTEVLHTWSHKKRS